jgi:hypothetical protein
MDKTEWRRQVETNFLVLGHTPRERITWTTIIAAAVVVRLGDDVSARTRAIIEDVGTELPAALMRSGRIGRNRTRYTGVMEFDLLIPRMLGGARKRALMTELGIDIDALHHTDRVVVVHWHGVIDHRGHASRAAMMRDLRHQWPGNWRVHGATLHDDKTVTDNLTTLASYSTKLKTTYSEAWQGRPTKFHLDFEPEWRQWMQALIDDVGFRNLIVSSVKSQKPECTPEFAQTLVPQGFPSDGDAMQLEHVEQSQEQPSSTIIPLEDDQKIMGPMIKKIITTMIKKIMGTLYGRTDSAILGTDIRDDNEAIEAAIDPGPGDEAGGARPGSSRTDEDDHGDGREARRGHQDHDGPLIRLRPRAATMASSDDREAGGGDPVRPESRVARPPPLRACATSPPSRPGRRSTVPRGLS